MPRPKKPRQLGCVGCARGFKPTGSPWGGLRRIPLEPDELEALRLCDLLGMTQEQAGESMHVSRGTVQRLVKSARAKVAEALVEGAAIVFTPPAEGVHDADI